MSIEFLDCLKRERDISAKWENGIQVDPRLKWSRCQIEIMFGFSLKITYKQKSGQYAGIPRGWPLNTGLTVR